MKTSIGAPQIAIDIYLRWKGKGDEEQAHGYPPESIMYRLLSDKRMDKVWPKIRQKIGEKHEDEEVEAVLYAFACCINDAAAYADCSQPLLSDIARQSELVAAKATALATAMKVAGFDRHHRDAVQRIKEVAEVNVLAARSKTLFKKKLDEANRAMLLTDIRAHNAGEVAEQWKVAQTAQIERENNSKFSPRVVGRKHKQPEVLRFIRTIRSDPWLLINEMELSDSLVAKLASVALNQEVNTEQVTEAYRKPRARSASKTRGENPQK